MANPTEETLTIAERVELGRRMRKIGGNSIVPFPEAWDEEMLQTQFASGEMGKLASSKDKGYKITSIHRYYDDGGALFFAVLRLEDGANKTFLPLRATVYGGWNPKFQIKSLDVPRPLYGLDLLACSPDKPVLIVEGEKTADAARVKFPGYVVISWLGGAQAIGNIDLRPLAGRNITIWPDNDDAGRTAAEKLGIRLNDLGVSSLTVVGLPPSFPDKWDLADAIPENCNDE